MYFGFRNADHKNSNNNEQGAKTARNLKHLKFIRPFLVAQKVRKAL